MFWLILFILVTGAGHGGRGGHGSGQPRTGAPYGCITQPVDHGCRGGTALHSDNTYLGGRGGGTIHLQIAETLQNDGEISCNGETGSSGSGGGSGGSIWMKDIGLIKVRLCTFNGY